MKKTSKVLIGCLLVAALIGVGYGLLRVASAEARKQQVIVPTAAGTKVEKMSR